MSKSLVLRDIVVECVEDTNVNSIPNSVLITIIKPEKSGASCVHFVIDMSSVDIEMQACLKQLLSILEDPSRGHLYLD